MKKTFLTLTTIMFVATLLAMFPGEDPQYEKATVAGGCFWCIEAPFEKVEGVIGAVSGYTGGHLENPTYRKIGTGRTGHLEAVQITFDPEVITYQEILDYFWRQFDPTDAGGSFVDRGSQYSSAIFYHNEAQKQIAEASKKQLAESGIFDKKIVTPIHEASVFYPAEEYHQDYYKKNPAHYKRYRSGSGRDQFIKKVWGKQKMKKQKSAYQKPSDAELREKLSGLQYQVTQKDGTERPFKNEYWDNKHEGIYVDIVSGEPLFSSKDKYKSGTGWPSFVRPLESNNIVEDTDYKLLYPRTEVRSKGADSHLGHLFKDGPQPTGLRYCINSASLRFIPRDSLVAEGYGKYTKIFE